MSDELDTTTFDQQGEQLSWSEVWISAITRPSAETFERLLQDPQATANRAYRWIFISSLIGYAIAALISFVINSLGVTSLGIFDLGEIFGVSIFLLLCCGPVAAALAVLGLAVSAGITQWIAKTFFGGVGSYNELVYTFAAFLSPLGLISSLLSPIPFISFLTIFISIYGLVLGVIAVKAVNQFGWGRALVSYLIIPFIMLLVVPICIIVVLVLLGPSVGNVYSNIIQGIGTPMP